MQELIAYFIQNPTALYIAVGLFSLCIGSFLNVVIYRTPKMMEPLIMAVLGILVGGLVVAMYLPIFQMGSVV